MSTSASGAIASRPHRSLKDQLLPWGTLVIIFIEYVLWGAEDRTTSLPAAIVHLLLLILVMLFVRQPRLPAPALFFQLAGLLGVSVLQLFPLGALANPAWSYVGKSPITSLDPWALRVEIINLLGLGALFIVGIQLGVHDRWRSAFFKGLVYLSLAYGAWAFIDYLASPLIYLGAPRIAPNRLSATFLSPNGAAALFGANMVIALCAFGRATGRNRGGGAGNRFSRVAPFIALFLVSGACLFATASRSGVAATFTSLLLVLSLMVWDRSRNDRLSGGALAVVLGVLGLAATLYLIGGENLTNRIDTIDPGLNGRIALWSPYWRAFLDAPFLGYGLGIDSQLSFLIASPSDPLSVAGQAPHNVYLQWLAETGLIGSAIVLTTIITIVLTTLKGFFRSSQVRPYVLTALGVLAVLALSGIYNGAPLVPSLCAVLSVLLGVAYGLCRRLG